MRGRKTLVLVLAVVLATCWTERATAQNRTSSNFERFQLFSYVRVSVVGGAFSMRLEFNKRVSDSLSGESFFAGTWDSSTTGTHGRDAGYILQHLSEQLDRFVLEYLRVNEAACG